MTIVQYLSKPKDVTRFLSTMKHLYGVYLSSKSKFSGKVWDKISEAHGRLDFKVKKRVAPLTSKGYLYEKYEIMRRSVMKGFGDEPKEIIQMKLPDSSRLLD